MMDCATEEPSRAPRRRLNLGCVANQNDFFRKMVFRDERIGKWVLSPAVMAKGTDFCLAAIEAVRRFDDFTPETDPSGQRAAGRAFVLEQPIDWAIELFGPDYRSRAGNPADVSETRRLLTISLPE